MEIPTLKCPIRKEVVEGIEEQADCMGCSCAWFTKCFDDIPDEFGLMQERTLKRMSFGNLREITKASRGES